MKANIVFEIVSLICFIAVIIVCLCDKDYLEALAWGNAALWCFMFMLAKIALCDDKKKEK